MTAEVTLLFATRNRGKLAELETLLADVRGLRVRSLDGYDLPDVIEDRDTFIGNAAKKALEVSQATGLLALADDSGLCVDHLDGAPGVYSARYAGPDASDDDNNRKLLSALTAVPESERGAVFRSALVLADANGPLGEQTIEAEGECRGVILGEPRGTGGFGYDPLFLVPSLGQTFAELGVGTKNDLSHRAQAMKAIRPELLAYFESRDWL